MLEQKETKIQDETPTPILFSHKSLRNTAEKIVVRSVSPKATAPLPMYERRKLNLKIHIAKIIFR